MRPKSDELDTMRPGAASAMLILAIAILPQSARAQGWNPPPPEQRCPSKWGASDERGAANLQTPQAVLKAARMIREGRVYELGKVLDASIPRSGARSYSLNLARTSFTKLGVEKIGGLFARGVMLDIAAMKGVDILPTTYEITVADLEEAMKRERVAFGAGDTVLVRTGW